MRTAPLEIILLAAVACAGDRALPAEPDDAGAADPAGDETGVEPEPPGEAEPEPDGSAPRFIDAQVYFQTPDDVDAWYALVGDLKGDFDAICGDTFCEGDFSNFESLRFRCSVEESAGTIGSCVWVLAASNEEIAPASGTITVVGEVFRCEMPIPAGTDIRAFIAALSVPGVPPIQADLPGSDRSLYDGLADCL